MGLNWAEGLKQAGAGMDTLGAAMQKTDELEYKNIRDKNLRRFALEDQATKAAAATTEREFKTGQAEALKTSKDEESGIGESERAGEYRTKEEEKRKQKQDDELEKIAARISKEKGGAKTRSEYISQKMAEMYDQYHEDQGIDLSTPPSEDDPASRMMPMSDAKMWEGRYGSDWDRIYGGEKTPFSPDEEKEVNWGDMPDG